MYLPINLNIEVTDHCNLQCQMCAHYNMPSPHGKAFPKKFIEIETVNKILDQIGNANLKIRCLSPFWIGESLMHPRFIEIANLIFNANKNKDLFDDFVLNTNAVLFTSELSDIFIEYGGYITKNFPNKNIFITFSLDFKEPEVFKKLKGASEVLAQKVLTNIEYFLRKRASLNLKKPTLSFQFVVQDENKHETKEFLRYWSNKLDFYGYNYDITDYPHLSQHIDSISLVMLRDERQMYQNEASKLHKQVLTEIGFYSSDYSEIYDSVVMPSMGIRKPCSQIWHSLLIASNGMVTPCCIDGTLQLSLGNIEKDTLLNIWMGDKLRELRILHIKGEQNSIPLCSKCILPPGGFICDKEIIEYLDGLGQEEELRWYLNRVGESNNISAKNETIINKPMLTLTENVYQLRCYNFYTHKDSVDSSIIARKIGTLEFESDAALEVTYRFREASKWVMLEYSTKNKNWSNFNFVNIRIKGDGKGGGLEFIIQEEDGDNWYYFIEDAFIDTGWKEFTLPLDNFILPEWATKGDCQRTLDNVKGYKLLFERHESALQGEKTVYIGNINLVKFSESESLLKSRDALSINDFKDFLARFSLPIPEPEGKMIENDIFLRNLSNLSDHGEILDVGCRGSALPIFLAKAGYKVTVIDIFEPKSGNKAYHEDLKRKILPEYYEILEGDFLTFDFNNKKFDSILAICSIEYFTEREVNQNSYEVNKGDIKSMEKIGYLLKENGIAIISVPFHRIRRDNEYVIGDDNIFERWYNQRDLYERIIKPSRLKLIQTDTRPYWAYVVLRKESAKQKIALQLDVEEKLCNLKIKQKSLNICLISREYPPDTTWGGIGTYTYNLAEGLAAAGENVHIIAQSLDIDKEYKDNGVYVHRVSHKSFFPFKGRFREFGLRWEYSQSVYNKLKEIIDKYSIDIVEAPNLSGEGFVYSFHKETPLVTRLHTNFSEVINFLGWKKTLDRRLSCWFENIAILRSDLITCSTKAHAELVAREIGMKPEKIKIIPLGVPLPEIYKEEKKNTNPIVLFVGRLEKRKGIHILIQSAPYVLRKIPNAKFIIIGRDSFINREEVNFSGPKERSYKEYLIKLIPEEYKDNVQFLGYVSPEELDKYYRMCDVFVAPSLYESFGFIYIEAMSYAKPVIGCGVGGAPEVIRDGVTGILVPPADEQRLADAIITLLKNIDYAKKMGNLAREYVKSRFSRNIMIRNTITAYIEICERQTHKYKR